MADVALRARQVAWRFALAGALLLLLWSQVSGLYVATLVPPANWLLGLGRAPMALARDGAVLVVGLQSPAGAWQALALQGQELASVNLVVALALMLALPGLSIRKRAAWSAGLLALLWVTQVLALCGGCWAAAGVYLSGLGSDSQLALSPAWGSSPMERSTQLSHLIGGWNAWGCPGLILVAGAAALPRQFWRNSA